MHVAILGTGSVGSALGAGWVEQGHDVVFGSRNPDSADVQSLVDVLGDAATATDLEDAASQGEVVVLAVPGAAVVGLARELASALAGKPVVDATNTYSPPPDRSLAETVADAAPDAWVVKAFNTIGANRFTDPVIGGETATMFLAGDDLDANDAVAGLAEDLGFDAFDVGGLDAAGMLEDLARFWIYLSRGHGRDIGFRLLRE